MLLERKKLRDRNEQEENERDSRVERSLKQQEEIERGREGGDWKPVPKILCILLCRDLVSLPYRLAPLVSQLPS